jgi:hypothetical protein
MRRMPDDETTPVERTELRSLDDLFRPSRPLRVMTTCCCSRGGTTRCCTHGRRLVGIAGILFMAAYCLAPQALVTDHRQSAVMAPLCMRLATPISCLGKEDRLLRHRWQCEQRDAGVRWGIGAIQ